ncbi:MAG: hypothetical protein AAGD22_14035 [Verrucomicrobiota bacterium]
MTCFGTRVSRVDFTVYSPLFHGRFKEVVDDAEMNEPYYSIACWAIRLSPVGVMATVWLIFRYRSPGLKQMLFTLGTGYVAGVLSVWWYYDFAGVNAPTEEIAEQVYSKDGAAQVFAPFVMPIFVGIYFVLMWPITRTITRILPVPRRMRGSSDLEMDGGPVP